MVVKNGNDPDAGGPAPGDVLEYAEAMGRQLAALCEQVGAGRAARCFQEAADLLSQLPDVNAAPGDAA